MFSSLHNHSEYSNTRLIDCIIRTNQLIDKSIEFGYKGVALTDHESLSGHIKFLKHYEKIKKSNPDFKIMLGNEIYLIPENVYKDTNRFFHFVLIAKDKIGHRQLRELSSMAWERSYYHKGMERVPTFYSDIEKVVEKDKGHLVGATACLGGFFPMAYLNGAQDKAEEFLIWGVNTFGENNFFIELQPAISDEQEAVNKFAYTTSKKLNIPCIITNDVHYLTKEDAAIHSAYLNSKQEEREVDSFYAYTYMKTEEEMREFLDYLPNDFITECFENTIKIQDSCEVYELSAPTVVPRRELPEFSLSHSFSNYYDKYPYIEKFANSPHLQDKFLLLMVEKGFEIHSQEFNETNLSRINIELEQIWEISEKLNERLSSYYNLTQELVDIMWKDDMGNSLVGVARGSVTGYYICYLMNITQVNPIEWNLPHWRHLHSSRPELPDIDVDTEASKRKQIIEAIRGHYGQNRVLNIATFNTEGSKASLLTACRGLNIDNDIAQELADMIPVERGKSWSISDCLWGNEEKERKPVPNFLNKMEQNERLTETALGIEGLVCGRSIHASGAYVYVNDYLEQSSLMRAPNGQPTTSWSMEDNDTTGALKVDLLTIESLDKLRTALEFLIKDGKIEWKGSLRDTYNAYLHPNVLNYTEEEMWNALGNNSIIDVFQFDTSVSINCLQKIKPRNLKEMALANSLMRLSAYNGEMPMDKYARFKKEPELWTQEMDDAGLNDEEQAILRGHLDSMFGIAAEQEDIMEMAMNPKISNFSVAEANLLRKAVAKKKADVLESAKSLFFEKGKQAKNRVQFLNYVWENCIMPQSGYSFSRNHTLPYSAIGLQEMNVYNRYGEIYWNAACLSVNASANDEDAEKSGSTNYGKIATAISRMTQRGIKIDLPDINEADFGFKPNSETGTIVFGLKGINGVGDDVVREIVEKRPYESLDDFLRKHDYKISTVPMVNLIKAGCFDKIEDKDRESVMKEYVKKITIINHPPLKTLTMSHFPTIIEYGMYVEKNWPMVKRYYNFYKYITQNVFKRGDEVNGYRVYWLDEKATLFFKEYLQKEMQAGTDYVIKDGEYHILDKRLKKWYNSTMDSFKLNFLRNPASLKRYNIANFNRHANDFWEKYCLGSIEKWEMDSLSFYYTKHELSNINVLKYGIVDFFQLPTNPTVNYTRKNKRGEYTQYHVYKIVGTVLDRDRIRKTITLLTPTGVVTVKMYSDLFVQYNKQISKVDEKGKKTVVDKSWFTRGTKLQIMGFRRDEQFFPRVYRDLVYKNIIAKIVGVSELGAMELVLDRPTGLEEEEDG